MNLSGAALPITIALIAALPAVQLKFRQSLQSACSHACCLPALLGHANSSAAMYNSRATKQRRGLTWRLWGAAMQNSDGLVEEGGGCGERGGGCVCEACSTFVTGPRYRLGRGVRRGVGSVPISGSPSELTAGPAQLPVSPSKTGALFTFFSFSFFFFSYFSALSPLVF